MGSSTRSRIDLGQIRVEFLVESEDSAGSVTVFEFFVAADAKVPVAHSHDGFEETIYGLEGSSTFTVGGRTLEIGPGDAICIPRGEIHGFANDSGEDAKFLAIATPGIFGPGYFQDLADLVATAAGGPPDPAAIVEVMRRHGLTPAPPATA
jgi:quercetin dioxygenase-like cupin family protein